MADSMSHRAVLSGAPVDFSFKKLTQLSDIFDEEPRSGQVRPYLVDAAPDKDKAKETTQAKPATPSPSKPQPKEVPVILKLNNNALTSIESLFTTMERILFDPRAITLLDLSFNHLKTIDVAALTLFPSLATLCLHANHIEKLAEVNKLSALPELKAVTLHGNEIEKDKNYRMYVLSRLPQLKKLDFAAVTKNDRESARAWGDLHASKQKRPAAD
eukprot:m.157234 g.157234  ORF g.157234 m.157234 type:complete len:215 (-) comp52949_c0_seq1:147-791(-)